MSCPYAPIIISRPQFGIIIEVFITLAYNPLL